MESLFALLVQRRGGCALILAHRDKVIQHAGGKWHRVDPPMPLDAFPQLVPPIEAAWRLDGTPRTACQCPVQKHCPPPTPDDRLCFLLTYLKTSTLHVGQARVCGMGQGTADPWIRVLVPALLAALRTIGDASTRSRTALAQR